MSAWKDLERRTCRLLGGERRGPTGRDMSDCTDDVPFAVEIKRSKRMSIQTAWIDQAKRHGKRERKPWLLVVCGHNDRRPLCVLDLYTFVELAQKAGVISTLSIAADNDDTATTARREISL